MKSIFGTITAITFAAILYSGVYAQATPSDVGEKQLARCDHKIERYSRFIDSDHSQYSYLSTAVFTVPVGENSCSFFYTLKSPILASFQETVGNPECSTLEKSVTCYDTIELGNYARIDTYTQGTNNEFPFATVEDWTNNDENERWWFFGRSFYVPYIEA